MEAGRVGSTRRAPDPPALGGRLLHEHGREDARLDSRPRRDLLEHGAGPADERPPAAPAVRSLSVGPKPLRLSSRCFAAAVSTSAR